MWRTCGRLPGLSSGDGSATHIAAHDRCVSLRAVSPLVGVCICVCVRAHRALVDALAVFGTHEALVARFLLHEKWATF